MKRSHLPGIITWLTLIFFYLPIILLVVNSVNANRHGTSWEGFTFQWYHDLFLPDQRGIFRGERGLGVFRDTPAFRQGGQGVIGHDIAGRCPIPQMQDRVLAAAGEGAGGSTGTGAGRLGLA